jgi:hypothetical protein
VRENQRGRSRSHGKTRNSPAMPGKGCHEHAALGQFVGADALQCPEEARPVKPSPSRASSLFNAVFQPPIGKMLSW